jgi:aspartate/methionine/tyrosine aminotransferase
LKIENLKLAPGKPGTPPVKTATPPSKLSHQAAAKPNQSPITRVNGAAGVRQAVAGEERRRSQRVLLRVRVNVHVALGSKHSTFEVTTLSVNDHGALIAMPRSLALDTQLVLEHGLTRKQVACKVVRVPREMPEGFHTPLEFEAIAPNFWGIAFPPSDWRPPDDV